MTQSIPLSDMEGTPSAKFPQLGDKHGGRITAISQRQQTNIKGTPLTFNDGQPRMQWIINVQEPNGDTLALYAKGGRFTPASGSGESMLTAIGRAVRTAGAEALDVGGELMVVHTGLGVPEPGQDAPKLYTAQYRPPAPQGQSVNVADLFDS